MRYLVNYGDKLNMRLAVFSYFGLLIDTEGMIYNTRYVDV